jgi:hypothetical protein
MTEPGDDFAPVPEPLTDTTEVRIMPIRDITSADHIVLPASPNADSGWRQVFPITYDVVIDAPTDEVAPAEDE